MGAEKEELAKECGEVLKAYFTTNSKEERARAHEICRSAIASGLNPLDFISIVRGALTERFHGISADQESVRLALSAVGFISTSLAPFEITLRALTELFDNSIDGMFVVDRETGRFHLANKAICRMLGYTLEELKKLDVTEIHPKEEISRILALFDERDKEQAFSVQEIPLRRKDKAVFCADAQVFNLVFEGKRYIAASFRDVAERKKVEEGVCRDSRDITKLERAEEECLAASAYARGLLESSMDPMVVVGPTGIIMDLNQATAEAAGHTREEMLGTDFSRYFTDPEAARKGLMTVMEKGFVRDIPLTIRHVSGKEMDIIANVTLFKNEKGEIQGAYGTARDITERKKAEEKLRRASRYARGLIEGSLDPLVTADPKGTLIEVNKAAEAITGRSREELIGTHIWDYFTEPKKAQEGLRIVLETGFIRDFPLAIRHTSGKVTEVYANGTVFRGENGEIQAVFAAARDITKLKNVERELRASASYIRNLFDISPDLMAHIDPDGRIIDINKAIESATGISREQLIGSDFTHYFVEPDKAREGLMAAIEKGFVRDLLLTIRHTSGKETDFLCNVRLLKNEKGEIQGVFGVGRDITERKKAEEELRAASRYARGLLESSMDPMVVVDPTGKIMDLNKATAEAVGLTREEMLGTDFAQYFTDPEFAVKGLMTVIEKGFIRDLPLTIKHVTGKTMDVIANVTLYKNEKGEILGAYGTARDITERKKAEEELRAVSRYSRQVIEASLDPLVVFDINGLLLDVNKATEDITGFSRGELIGSGFWHYFADPEKAKEILPLVLKQNVVRDFSLAAKHKSGKTTDVLANAVLFRDEKGQVKGIFGAARDISKLKKTEQDLRSIMDYARGLLEASFELMANIGLDGTILDFNKAVEDATGLRRDQIIGMEFADLFTDPESARKGFQEALEEGFIRDLPLSIEHRSGKVTDFLYNVTTYRNEQAQIQSIFSVGHDITEHKKDEERLKESEQKFRAIFDNAVDGLLVVDEETKKFYLGNKTICRMLGYSWDELEHLGFEEIHPKEALPHVFDEFEKQKSGELLVAKELPVKRKDGSVFFADISTFPIVIGGKRYLAGNFRDITERKKAEEKLRASAQYARDLIEASLDPLVSVDLDGRFIEVNKALEKLTGYSREELLGSDFLLVLADPEKGREGFKTVLEQGFVRDLPLTFRHRSGKLIETLANGTLIRNEAGAPLRIFAAARDITKLKEAEEERFALANRVQALLDSTEEGILGLDKEGRVKFVNRAAARMLGYRPKNLLGQDAHNLIHHHFSDGRPYPPELCPIRRVSEGQRGVRVENEVFWTILGCSIPVEYIANPIFHNGEVVGVVEVFTDITVRKRSEEALKQKELEIRRAYADVFFAVTGGRLGLVTDEEMRSVLGKPVTPDVFSISKYQELSAARERLRIAIMENFPEARSVAEDLIIAASEALSNAVKHAGGGTYTVFRSSEALQIMVHDSGPGIDFKTLPKATLLSGFSTTQTMGVGFSIMLEICSRVLISTQPDSTSIVLEYKLPVASEQNRWELRVG